MYAIASTSYDLRVDRNFAQGFEHYTLCRVMNDLIVSRKRERLDPNLGSTNLSIQNRMLQGHNDGSRIEKGDCRCFTKAFSSTDEFTISTGGERSSSSAKICG